MGRILRVRCTGIQRHYREHRHRLVLRELRSATATSWRRRLPGGGAAAPLQRPSTAPAKRRDEGGVDEMALVRLQQELVRPNSILSLLAPSSKSDILRKRIIFRPQLSLSEKLEAAERAHAAVLAESGGGGGGSGGVVHSPEPPRTGISSKRQLSPKAPRLTVPAPIPSEGVAELEPAEAADDAAATQAKADMAWLAEMGFPVTAVRRQ
eukprot:SAG11_NODE_816_length_7030_cov_15.673784_4_plen_209_part_00